MTSIPILSLAAGLWLLAGRAWWLARRRATPVARNARRPRRQSPLR